ncbi:MAG: hypothetical protein LBJ77_00875 [Holosporales bacterium]|nr:hypothetical protein [Holosporales bacterium]
MNSCVMASSPPNVDGEGGAQEVRALQFDRTSSTLFEGVQTLTWDFGLLGIPSGVPASQSNLQVLRENVSALEMEAASFPLFSESLNNLCVHLFDLLNRFDTNPACMHDIRERECLVEVHLTIPLRGFSNALKSQGVSLPGIDLFVKDDLSLSWSSDYFSE